VDDFQYSASQPASASGVITDATGTKIYVTGYAKDSSGYQNWITRISTDSGATWSNSDIYQLSATKMAIGTQLLMMANGDLYVAGSAQNASGILYYVVRQLPSGGSWSTVDSSIKNNSSNYSAITQNVAGDIYTAYGCNGSSCFTGAVVSNYGMLRKSTNGVWSNVGQIPSAFFNSYYSLGIELNGTIDVQMCGGGVSAYYSTDGGVTYTTRDSVGTITAAQVLGEGGVAIGPNGNYYHVGSNSIVVNGSPLYWWVRKMRFDGSFAYLDQYQLTAGYSAAATGIVVNATNTFVCGGAYDTTSVSHWIVRKF
jgi:hypothetical protein